VRIGRRVIVREATLALEHVLGSAAIPVLFSPVAIDGDLYCDGGLRLNTPIGPAIRLGARKVLAIGLSTTREAPAIRAGRYPAASFLLGKVLNAFLLDHVMSDLDELARINQFLEDGTRVHGADFAGRMGEVAHERGDPAYHPVEATVVRPSEDLAVIAAEHLRRMRRKVGRISAGRLFLRMMEANETPGSDLASYLLFDGTYARDLIELGRRDGQANTDAIDRFLAE
jgi:NTE family protein